MATQVQFRRGTTSQNNAFTGAQGEITVDTDVYALRIHDGTTAGGKVVPTLTATQTFTNKTLGGGSTWNGNVIGLTYGGTGAALTAVAGGIAYSTASVLALSAAGTSGQVLTSGGTSAPTWINASGITVGTATNATNATNIAGGSAGYLVYQSDTNTTSFITPGTDGYLLKSTGASTAPTWIAPGLTLGSTAVSLGGTTTSFAGVTSITMGNGSYAGGTVASVSGAGPWTATITGISSTTGIMVGQNITATAGTGTLFGGTPTSVLVASIVSGTSITVTVTGGTTPTTGTITSITTFGFLQVPAGTTAQRPYVPAVGMIRYNSTQSSFEGYASGAWSSLGGVKSVDGYTYIQAETSAGASNGDLDFYAEDSAGTAATQVGQWNRTNLKDYTGTLVGTQTTQNVFNATATTVNAFGAATALNLGAATGTLTVANTTLAAKAITASTTLVVTGATTLNGGLTMDTDKFTVADTTGNTAIGGTLAVTGNTTLTGDLAVNGGDITTSQTTFNLLNTTATTLNIGGAATTLSIGSAAVGATTTFAKNVTIVGNLTVQGTTTTEASAGLTVSDSAVYLNDGATGNTKDIGIIGEYKPSATTLYTGVVKDATDSVWKFFSAPTNAPASGSIVDFTGATYDSVRIGGLTATTGSFSSTLNVTGATTLSAALTYGGVTLSNAVTGTGNMVLATSPSISGLTLTGTLTAGGGVGTNGQYLQSTSTGVQWASLSGTISLAGTTGTGSVSTGGTLTFASSNGVVSSVSSSTVTVSTAQDIRTTAAPTFAGVTTTNGITATSVNPFVYTATTVSANVTIPSSYNAMAAGPITVNTGVTITIPDGSTLTIV